MEKLMAAQSLKLKFSLVTKRTATKLREHLSPCGREHPGLKEGMSKEVEEEAK